VYHEHFVEEIERKNLKNDLKRKKVTIMKEKTIGESLFKNRELLTNPNLTKDERYKLRRENLLVIQEKFYEIMEKNPHIFKIQFLLFRRKKLLKEKKYRGFIRPDKIDYEPTIEYNIRCKFSKQVKKH